MEIKQEFEFEVLGSTFSENSKGNNCQVQYFENVELHANLINHQTMLPETEIKQEFEFEVLDSTENSKENNSQVQNSENVELHANLIDHETMLPETENKQEFEFEVLDGTENSKENNIWVQNFENVELHANLINHQTMLLETEIKQEFEFEVLDSTENSKENNCQVQNSENVELHANLINHRTMLPEIEIKQEFEFEVLDSRENSKENNSQVQNSENDELQANLIDHRTMLHETEIKQEFEFEVLDSTENSKENICLVQNSENVEFHANLINHRTMLPETEIKQEFEFEVLSGTVTGNSQKKDCYKQNTENVRLVPNLVNHQTVSQDIETETKQEFDTVGSAILPIVKEENMDNFSDTNSGNNNVDNRDIPVENSNHVITRAIVIYFQTNQTNTTTNREEIKEISPGITRPDPDSENIITGIKGVAEKKRRKKNPKEHCPYCGSFTVALTRHLKTTHYAETEVIEAVHLPTKARNKAFSRLKRRGYYKFNMETLTDDDCDYSLLLKERKEGTKINYEEDLVKCNHCRGFFFKEHLTRHQKYTCFGFKGTTAMAAPVNVEVLKDKETKRHQGFIEKILPVDKLGTGIGEGPPKNDATSVDSVSGHSNGAMCPLITDSGTTKNQHDTMYRDQTLPQTESNNDTTGNDSNNIEKVLHNSCNDEDNSIVYFDRYITAETDSKKSYMCTTCGLQLSTKLQTKLHMRTHNGEKKLFGYRKINLHEKISYVCLSCGDQFSSKFNIKLHIVQIHMTASTEGHGTDWSSNQLPKNQIGASKSSVNVTELPIGQLAVNTDNIIANENILSDIPAHIIVANIYWDHSYVKKSTTKADLPLHTTEKNFVNRKLGKRGRRRKKTSTSIWARSATKQFPKNSTKTLSQEEQNDGEKTTYPSEGSEPETDKAGQLIESGKIGGRRRRRPGRLGYHNTLTSRDSDESMEDDRSEKCLVNEDPDFNPSDNNECSETESESESSDISSDEIPVTSKRIKLSKNNNTSSVHTGNDTEDTLNKPKKGNHEQICEDQSESEVAGYSSENVRNLNVAHTKMKKGGKRIDKKRCCVYCNKQYCRISKHLENVHYKETEVQKALSYSKNSWKRKRKWRKLMNKCNFASNMKTLEKGYGD